MAENKTKITLRQRLTIKILCFIIKVLNYSWYKHEYEKDLKDLLADLDKIKD